MEFRVVTSLVFLLRETVRFESSKMMGQVPSSPELDEYHRMSQIAFMIDKI
jgi:hypothetical protein